MVKETRALYLDGISVNNHHLCLVLLVITVLVFMINFQHFTNSPQHHSTTFVDENKNFQIFLTFHEQNCRQFFIDAKCQQLLDEQGERHRMPQTILDHGPRLHFENVLLTIYYNTPFYQSASKVILVFFFFTFLDLFLTLSSMPCTTECLATCFSVGQIQIFGQQIPTEVLPQLLFMTNMSGFPNASPLIVVVTQLATAALRWPWTGFQIGNFQNTMEF